ncbi:unnamed protein product [Pylaiella littoralis]
MSESQALLYYAAPWPQEGEFITEYQPRPSCSSSVMLIIKGRKIRTFVIRGHNSSVPE